MPAIASSLPDAKRKRTVVWAVAVTTFTVWLLQAMETKLALASSIPDVKVLDPAVPPTQPSTNSAPRIILMGFLLSLALAVGIAILLDRLDKRFQYPEQVTQELGLSILGAIPAINKVKGSVRNAEEASQVVEAFRTIRLNLALVAQVTV